MMRSVDEMAKLSITTNFIQAFAISYSTIRLLESVAERLVFLRVKITFALIRTQKNLKNCDFYFQDLYHQSPQLPDRGF